MLFLVGDSTVHNTSLGLVGWGDVIGRCFDTNRIIIENHALPGRSSRTFQTQGWWAKVLAVAHLGVFPAWPQRQQPRQRHQPLARHGLGLEVTNNVNGLTHRPETVHTYGWYMRKCIANAQARQMTPIISSSVSRLPQAGKELDTTCSAPWARELAAK